MCFQAFSREALRCASYKDNKRRNKVTISLYFFGVLNYSVMDLFFCNCHPFFCRFWSVLLATIIQIFSVSVLTNLISFVSIKFPLFELLW